MPRKVGSENDIEKALRSAKSIQPGNDLYSNVQRVTVTSNEVILDFYLISPDFDLTTRPKATHLQRIFLPIKAAKELAKIINSTIAKVESGESSESLDLTAESTENE